MREGQLYTLLPLGYCKPPNGVKLSKLRISLGSGLRLRLRSRIKLALMIGLRVDVQVWVWIGGQVTSRDRISRVTTGLLSCHLEQTQVA